MKQNILLALALFSLNVLVAQDMEFNVSPVVVNDVPAADFEGVGHAEVTNTAAIERNFRWNMNVVEKATEWEVAFCDKNLCYGSDILSQDYTLTAGEAGRMDVHAYPNNREGYAIVEIVNTDLDNENLQISNLYYFNSDPTSTQDIYRQTIKVYPNPSNGLFSVKGEAGISRVQVYSLTGQQVNSFTYGDGQWYDISNLPRGTYMVRLIDRDGQQMITKLMNKL